MDIEGVYFCGSRRLWEWESMNRFQNLYTWDFIETTRTSMNLGIQSLNSSSWKNKSK